MFRQLSLLSRNIPRGLNGSAGRGATLRMARSIHSTLPIRGTTTLPNILSGGPAPPVVVKTLTPRGLQLDDGLIIPGPCLFLEGEVFLWDVPSLSKGAWNTLSEEDVKARFEVFETVVPRPGANHLLHCVAL
jgi:NADH dehydrogenase [ubiquinone] 1 alpha subcomplex assembly factor 3